MLKENFIIFLIFLAILISCFTVSAQTSSLELTCRSQAKDIAVTTYNNCMTEGRNKHIESIRGEYQQKLKELKSHYDNELKKLDGAPATSAPQKLQPQDFGNQIKSNNKPKKVSVLRTTPSARRPPQVLPQKTTRTRQQPRALSPQQEVVVSPSQEPVQQTYEDSSPYPEKDEDSVDVIDLPAQE